MKKRISVFLAVLLCFSVIASIAVPASAAVVENNVLTVTNTKFENDEITYTVALKGGVTKLNGANIRVNFNAADLQVVECVPNESKIPGMYATGPVAGTEGSYSVAYINASGYTISADTTLFTIKFKAISSLRPVTKVNVELVEFVTDNGINDDLLKSDPSAIIFEHEFHTLGQPEVSAVDSVNSTLKVQWDAVPGAESYDVFRKAEGSDAWEKVTSSPVEVNEYIDADIAQGKEYTYTVIANNSYGSTEQKDTGVAGMYFGTIEEIDVEAFDDGIRVFWSALAGAEKYEVSRKLATDSSWTKIATVTDTQYEDTTALSGQEYNYQVKAVKGQYTAGMSAEIPVAKYLGRPVISVVNTMFGLQINFPEVIGAESYTILKSVNDGEAFVLLSVSSAAVVAGRVEAVDTDVNGKEKYTYTAYAESGDIKSADAKQVVITRLAAPVISTVENTDNGVFIAWESVDTATGYDIYRTESNGERVYYATVSNSTSYTDRNAHSGNKYTYTVVAKNSTGVSAFGESGLSIVRVNTPAGISAFVNTNGVNLQWSGVSGAEGYTVYRKTASGEFEVIGTSATENYVDTTALKDVVYTYTVSANIGEYSGALNSAGVEAKNIGTVSQITSSLIEKGVKLSWTSLSGAQGYRVYRKTVNDSAYTLIATATSNTYEDKTIPSGVACEYKIEAYYGSCVSQMSAAAHQTKFLATPVVDAGNAGEGVISVKIVPVYGAEKYILERADGDGKNGAFKVVATLTGGKTEYTDTTNIVAGNTYTYRVTAIGTSIDGGELKSGTSTDTITKMIAPSIQSLSNLVSGVKVTWNAVPDATTYNVYRKLPEQTSWGTPVFVTSSLQFIDASVGSGEMYQYTVEANTPDGPTGYNLIGKSIYFLETPDVLSVSNSNGGVTFKWRGVEGATGYQVYRRTSTGGWVYVGATAKTYLLDKGAKAKITSGAAYRYTVRAYFKTDEGVVHRSNFDSTGLVIRYMATPKMHSLTNGANGITVKWNKVSGAKGYRIYRKTSKSGWTYVTTVSASKNSYLDTAVKSKSGTAYAYTVRAFNGNYVSAYESGLVTRRLTNPVLKSATSAKAGITVKWNAVTGSTGYYIYRKTAGKGWTLVGKVNGKGTITYLDKTARKGVTYTYTVRAFNSKYLSSFNSTGVSCKDRY